jgi:hypothetical protein
MRSRSRWLLMGWLAVSTAGTSALASSHREAPLAAQHAASDLTDVYIFRSPENPNNVVMVLNVWPFSDPMGAPNYTQFGYDTFYQFNIDYDGDSAADVTWEYSFNVVNNKPFFAENAFAGVNTFLYNTGVLSIGPDGTAPNWNIVQRARVVKSDTARPILEYSRNGLLVPPENIGAPSTPGGDYSLLEKIHSVETANGLEKHYFGPRDDPFWVDLGIFNLLSLRGLKDPKQRYVDSLRGYNVLSIVLEVPIANVAAPGANCLPGPSNDPGCVVGFWATTYKGDVALDGMVTKGDQISRLGMPLVNEVVIPLEIKDAFNGLHPANDVATLIATDNLGAIFQPELAGLLAGAPDGPPGPDVPGTAVGILDGVIPAGNDSGAFGLVRCDIVRIFLTGFDGTGLGLANNSKPDGWLLPGGLCGEVNEGGARASEMLRINLSTPVTPYAQQNRLGALGEFPNGPVGDPDGFPNGRRLGDDVVDIELRVVAGVLSGVFGDTSCPACSAKGSLHGILSDAILAVNQNEDRNDVDFSPTFPYLAPPHAGYNHEHHSSGIPGAIAAIVIGSQTIGIAILATLLLGRRRRRAQGSV